MKYFLIFVLIIQCASQATAQVGSGKDTAVRCLYNAGPNVKPANINSSITKENSTFYLLKNGSYVTVVDWGCHRYGKRILIVVPIDLDSAEYVNSILMSLIDKNIAAHFAQALRDSYGKNEIDIKLQLAGLEEPMLSARRNEYETVYTIIYYTSD